MPRKQVAINDSSAAAGTARATKPKTTRAKSAKHSKATAQESVSQQSVSQQSLSPEMEAAVIENVLAAEPVIVVEPVVVIEPVIVVEPVAIAMTQNGMAEDGMMRAEATLPEQAREAPALEKAREEMERMAYGYWEARGRMGGDPVEDWVRAENEYRQRYSL